jgi:uncharacterized paraquat-inducible protein A
LKVGIPPESEFFLVCGKESLGLTIGAVDTTMKTSRTLALAALILFAISHFLPAYDTSSGFACFGICWNMLFERNNDFLTAGWFYYSAFAISNILFVGLIIAFFITNKSRGVRLSLAIVMFLHVLSWFALHVFEQPPQIAPIKIGYYIWLLAYSLLVAAHFKKKPIKSLDPIPLAPSAV